MDTKSLKQVENEMFQNYMKVRDVNPYWEMNWYFAVYITRMLLKRIYADEYESVGKCPFTP